MENLTSENYFIGFKDSLKERLDKLYTRKEIFVSRAEKYEKLYHQKFMQLLVSKKLTRVEKIYRENRKRSENINQEIFSLESTIENIEEYFGV